MTGILNVDMSREFISTVSYRTVTWRVIKLWINKRELFQYVLILICVDCTKVIHMSISPLLSFLDVHKRFLRAFYYLFAKDYINEMGLSLIFWSTCLDHFDIGYNLFASYIAFQGLK